MLYCVVLYCIVLHCLVLSCPVFYCILLSNCISYCTKSTRNEYKYPMTLNSCYCTVLCAHSSCYTYSFLSSYSKRLKKDKLDNKSLIRCFGVKNHRIFLLIVCIKYTAILHTKTSNKTYTFKFMHYGLSPSNAAGGFIPSYSQLLLLALATTSFPIIALSIDCIALHCIALHCIEKRCSHQSNTERR